MKIRHAAPSPRLPEYYLLGEVFNHSIHQFIDRIDRPELFGMIIPPYQRQLVWTPQQEVAFIESWFKGLHIGTFMIALRGPDMHLLDGQQRMHTLKRYLQSEFEVFGLKYSDLTKTEQNFFLRRTLPIYMVMNDLEEEEYRELYITLNFSGTQHTEGDHPLREGFQGQTILKK